MLGAKTGVVPVTVGQQADCAEQTMAQVRLIGIFTIPLAPAIISYHTLCRVSVKHFEVQSGYVLDLAKRGRQTRFSVVGLAHVFRFSSYNRPLRNASFQRPAGSIGHASSTEPYSSSLYQSWTFIWAPGM